MTGGHLKMSNQDRDRLKVCERIDQGELTRKEGAQVLRLSYRQMRRICRRYENEGDAGLIHRNRGQRSHHAIEGTVQEAILERYQARYEGFGPTLAAEKLTEEKLQVDHETLRRWLVLRGLWKKKRHRCAHRKWRERKAHFGELIQMDGSFHRWFGGTLPADGEEHFPCLMVMVDDATGVSLARFSEEETTEAAMRLLWEWIEQYGVPLALYTDRKNVYVTDREPTVEEQLKGEAPLTVLGKACAKLKIEIKRAHSPQAKGRVERKNGLYQDRLVKEIRLAGIQTIEEGNRFLKEGFLNQMNQKFAVPPAQEADFHRPLLTGIQLQNIFCFEEIRQVQNDWTIRYENRFFQIKQENRPLPLAKGKVTVCRWLDGSLHLYDKGRELLYQELPERPRPEVPKPPPHSTLRRHVAPAATHPWRRPFLPKSLNGAAHSPG